MVMFNRDDLGTVVRLRVSALQRYLYLYLSALSSFSTFASNVELDGGATGDGVEDA